MTIHIKLFFGLEEFSPYRQKEFSLDSDRPLTVRAVVQKLDLPEESMLIVLNDQLSALDAYVNPGDRLKIYPWLAGG